MTIPDIHPHAQAVRLFYDNEQPVSASAFNNIIHIAYHPDPCSGKDIILWEDIKAAFDDVMHVRSGTFVLPFLKGPDFKNLDPLRIAAVPGVTLDVVIKSQLSSGRMTLRPQAALSNRLSSSSSRSTKEHELFSHSEESFPPAPPEYSSIITQDLRETERKASLGDKDAQVALGDMYKNGHRVQQDYQIAMDWYLKAADQGLARAQLNVGYMHDYGLGVPQDYAKAKDWYFRAAEQDYAPAQNSVGDLYTNGHGVPQDYTQAMYWYLKAANQEDPFAQNSIGCLYHNGRGIPKDFSQAMAWYQKASDQGNISALANIGWLHEHGQGVSKDETKAMEWYKKAADGGHAGAKERFDKWERRDNGGDSGKKGRLLSRFFN